MNDNTIQIIRKDHYNTWVKNYKIMETSQMTGIVLLLDKFLRINLKLAKNFFYSEIISLIYNYCSIYIRSKLS